MASEFTFVCDLGPNILHVHLYTSGTSLNREHLLVAPTQLGPNWVAIDTIIKNFPKCGHLVIQ